MSPSTSSAPAKMLRIAVLCAFAGSLAATMPASAATAADAPQKITAEQTEAPKNKYEQNRKMNRSPQAMAQRLEDRIKTLHEKLGITNEQEEAWAEVAQTMRDNEATTAALIKERHENAKDMTAIDDLHSYEAITQSHADGIKRLITVFEPLYDDMSDNQKVAADEAFGRFEGRRGGMSAKNHK